MFIKVEGDTQQRSRRDKENLLPKAFKIWFTSCKPPKENEAKKQKPKKQTQTKKASTKSLLITQIHELK